MKRWHKVLIAIVIVTSIIGVILFFFGRGLYYSGLYCCYQYEDLHLGPYLPPVNEIRIKLLGGLKDINAPFVEGDISYYKILGEATLHGKEADHLADYWRYLPRNQLLSDLCHSPLYGLEFRNNGQLLFATTICWHCNNYTLSPSGHSWLDGEFGFDASSPISRKFLTELERLVPLPARK